MNQEAYNAMIALEEDHWWFRARRKILCKILSHFKVGRTFTEVGCGTGRNIDWLKTLGDTAGIEPSLKMIEHAQKKGHSNLINASFPTTIPSDYTDNICLFDVLEHIEDDKRAIEHLSASQSSGQRLFVTVPAYQWLYGSHDISHHHYKRYSKRELVELLERSNYRVIYKTNFNSFLLPIAIIKRLIDKVIPNKKEGSTGLVNEVLYRIFEAESPFYPRASVPFGLSILVVAEKC